MTRELDSSPQNIAQTVPCCSILRTTGAKKTFKKLSEQSFDVVREKRGFLIAITLERDKFKRFQSKFEHSAS